VKVTLIVSVHGNLY